MTPLLSWTLTIGKGLGLLWAAVMAYFVAPSFLDASGQSFRSLTLDAYARFGARAKRGQRREDRYNRLGTRTGYVGRMVIALRVLTGCIRHRRFSDLPPSLLLLCFALLPNPLPLLFNRVAYGLPVFVISRWARFVESRYVGGASLRSSLVFTLSTRLDRRCAVVQGWWQRRMLAWRVYRQLHRAWKLRRNRVNEQRPRFRTIVALADERVPALARAAEPEELPEFPASLVFPPFPPDRASLN